MKFKLFVIFALIMFMFCSCAQEPETYTYTPPEKVHDPESCNYGWCEICHPEKYDSNYVSYGPRDYYYDINYYYIIEDTTIKRIQFDRTLEKSLDSNPLIIEIWQLPVGLSFNDPEFYSDLEDAAAETIEKLYKSEWDKLGKSGQKGKTYNNWKTEYCYYTRNTYTPAIDWLKGFTDMDLTQYTSHVPPDIIYEGRFKTDTYYEKNDDYKEGSALITERMFNEYEYVEIYSIHMADIYEYKNGGYVLEDFNSDDWSEWLNSYGGIYWGADGKFVWDYIRDNGIPLVGNPYNLSSTIYDSYEDNGEYYEGYFEISSEVPHERYTSYNYDPDRNQLYKNDTLKTYVCTKEEALSNASILANQTFSHTLPSLSDLQ
jgi:hypothetical protein